METIEEEEEEELKILSKKDRFKQHKKQSGG